MRADPLAFLKNGVDLFQQKHPGSPGVLLGLPRYATEPVKLHDKICDILEGTRQVTLS